MPTHGPDQITRQLETARELLSGSDSHDSYDWLLIATLIASADLGIQALRKATPSLEVPLLGEVLAMLRQATLSPRNRQEFLMHTKAARRRNPGIFTGVV